MRASYSMYQVAEALSPRGRGGVSHIISPLESETDFLCAVWGQLEHNQVGDVQASAKREKFTQC
jgi:hypothetical protein